MENVTEAQRERIAETGRRHGVGETAALALFRALAAGGGRMAQFNHPDLGGLGQWSAGGMVMVGDMFDHALKARVDGLCRDLAALVEETGEAASAASENWWPQELGSPASSGAQNDLRYAFFPARRRLAVETGGQVRVYDTGDHAFNGFGQQQGGSGVGGLAFTGAHGAVRLDDLPLADKPQTPPAPPMNDDVVGRIERLASLHERGLLSQAEFVEAKAALLRRD